MTIVTVSTVPVVHHCAMASFELKPLHHAFLGSSADSIMLQPGRCELPVLLVNRTTIEEWHQTFESVHQLHAKHLQAINGAAPWVMIPCCICCTMPKLASMQMSLQDDWADICRSEQHDTASMESVHLFIEKSRQRSGWPQV